MKKNVFSVFFRWDICNKLPAYLTSNFFKWGKHFSADTAGSAARSLQDHGHTGWQQLIWPFSRSLHSAQQVSNSLQKQFGQKLPHAERHPWRCAVAKMTQDRLNPLKYSGRIWGKVQRETCWKKGKALERSPTCHRIHALAYTATLATTKRRRSPKNRHVFGPNWVRLTPPQLGVKTGAEGVFSPLFRC